MTERRRCEHDRREFAPCVPIGTDPRTFKPARLRMLKQCPYKALETSRFCMPHSVLHGETHATTATFIADAIMLYGQGLLIVPPSVDGRMVLPVWWPVRFN